MKSSPGFVSRAPSRIALALLLAALGGSACAWDRDGDDEGWSKGRGKGHGRGHDRDRDHDERREHGNNHRYHFKDERCEYSYMYNEKSGRSMVKQKGDCGHVAPPVAVVETNPIPRVVAPVAIGGMAQCDHGRLGQVLGGVVGGVIGSQVGKDGNRPVATVAGALIGVLVGGEISRRMNQADHGCMSQALDFGHANQPVQWKNGPGIYTVIPGAPVNTGGTVCRPFVTKLTIGGKDQQENGRACRQPNGSWVKS